MSGYPLQTKFYTQNRPDPHRLEEIQPIFAKKKKKEEEEEEEEKAKSGGAVWAGFCPPLCEVFVYGLDSWVVDEIYILPLRSRRKSIGMVEK
jgi:hypothetical protein